MTPEEKDAIRKSRHALVSGHEHCRVGFCAFATASGDIAALLAEVERLEASEDASLTALAEAGGEITRLKGIIESMWDLSRLWTRLI